eukprot:XP_008182093.1 PREDICTED: uncharacterized protein LOC103309149 [Acyrthosiphon pisum]
MKSHNSYESNLLPKAGAITSNLSNHPAKPSSGLQASRLSLPRVPMINEDKEKLHSKCHKIICNTTNKSLKSKKPCLIPQRKHKVIEENRIHYQVDGEDDDTELYDSVTLFQRLLRGRAYQTMIIMATIRYHQFYTRTKNQ